MDAPQNAQEAEKGHTSSTHEFPLVIYDDGIIKEVSKKVLISRKHSICTLLFLISGDTSGRDFHLKTGSLFSTRCVIAMRHFLSKISTNGRSNVQETHPTNYLTEQNVVD